MSSTRSSASKSTGQSRPSQIDAAESPYHQGNQPEASFQQQVIDAAHRCGWLVYHTYDSRRSPPGFPDLVLAHRDRGVAFIELKKKGGRPTDEQKHWIETLTKAGHRATVLWPEDLDWLLEFLNGRPWT